MHDPQIIPVMEGNTDILYAPNSQFREWMNLKSFPNTVCYGQKQIPIQVQPHPDQIEQYAMTCSLQKKLNWPADDPVHLFDKDSILYAGPIVGIFTAGFTSNLHLPFGERTKMFAKLLSAARRNGVICFVFGSHHIDWEKSEITGYQYDASGWSRKDFPFPNIIYDRLPNRRIEQMQVSVETKGKLQEQGALWFNPGFFDKWQVYEKLKTDKTVRNFLPNTVLSPNQNQIEQLLSRYRNIYLKPTNGSLGNGIQQIIKRKNDPFYYIRFRSSDSNRLRRYTSLKRLLRKQFANGTDGFMAQQGIHLVQSNGNAIDFRVHTNRGRRGQWEVSAIAAKLAGSDSITTHITSGGKTLSLSEIINDLGLSKTIVQDIKEAALSLSDALSEHENGEIGEIGFDLGVDEKGSIWMFEANSKPGRSIFDHPNLNAYDRKTLELPFQYALYLFEQSIGQQAAVKQ
ncbi:YheC/YheD family endospore coat-associated protein [Pseudalkalibacillus sp. Hm43]|uniref:YheC/YheD family endospore coat-associated protein n=1 Tax=Pseudalkalibacillus sp. Hm43 TaxID=3450742 RepID=UPI003F41C9FB